MNLYLALISDLMARLGWRLPVLVAWTVFVGLGESVSVALLLPLMSRAGVAAAGGQGSAIKLLDAGLALLGATSPVQVLAVIIAVAAIQTALSITLNRWTVILARRYQRGRQLEMFGAFMRAKWTFIVGRKAGEMTNAIIMESERLGRAFLLCLSLLASAVVAAIYVILALLVAWQVTLCLIAFAVASALTMAHLYKKSFAVGQSLAPLNAELQSALDENFAGAKFIKASDGEEYASARIDPLVRKLERANAYAGSLPGTVRNLLEFIAFIGLAVILVIASAGMGTAPGNVVVVLALFGRLFPRLTTVQAQLHYLNGNVQAIEAINGLQTAAEADAERRDRVGEVLALDLPTTLAIRNLQVKFGGRAVLDQINLTLPLPGLLAVVGKSGAGKSTLVHTLLGLVEPSAGSIRLGSCELAAAPIHAWRRAVGYVPQETILFHASILDNLTVVDPAASAADVRAAARRAHTLDFIEALPKGWDTIIGDQGVKLSGGQRQRLGIARALLRNPVLLLLDEAMSALDTESEAEVLRTIEELRRQMGILIVTHRLAAVRAADVICVIESGRMVESGTWNDLMARRTRLYALAETQTFADAQPSVAAL